MINIKAGLIESPAFFIFTIKNNVSLNNVSLNNLFFMIFG